MSQESGWASSLSCHRSVSTINHHVQKLTMKTNEIFKLAVKLLGLYCLYQSLQSFPLAIGQFLGALPRVIQISANQTQSIGMNGEQLFGSSILIIWPFILAFWLLRGAPLIMRLAYPNTPAGSPSETQEGGALDQKSPV